MSEMMKLFLAAAITAGAVFSPACNSTQTENTADKPAVIAENSNEPVKITVSKNGYEPKSIGVKKGQPVKLAFLRTDEENCGGELVFPKLNIRKNLPIGETVLVEFTPQESSEIGFTCGMDMLRGKVIVQ